MQRNKQNKIKQNKKQNQGTPCTVLNIIINTCLVMEENNY